MAEINRFRAYPPSGHSRFYERVFNDYEFRYCTDHSDPYPHFAGIFAAKEAVLKAVGKFFPLSLFQICINHDETGRPTVWLEKSDRIPQNKIQKNFENLVVQVSITHSSDLALAWALVFINTSQNDALEGLNRLKVELQREICNEFVEHRCTS